MAKGGGKVSDHSSAGLFGLYRRTREQHELQSGAAVARASPVSEESTTGRGGVCLESSFLGAGVFSPLCGGLSPLLGEGPPRNRFFRSIKGVIGLSFSRGFGRIEPCGFHASTTDTGGRLESHPKPDLTLIQRAMSQTAQIRSICSEDLDALAVFNAEFEGDQCGVAGWKDRMEHWWCANPAFFEDWSRGSVMDHAGSIVGVSLGIPFRIISNGQEQVAVLRGTWRVQKAYRSQSLALSLDADLHYSKIVNLNGTASARVFKMASTFGWHCLRETMDYSVIPISWSRLAGRRMGRAREPRPLPALVSDGFPAYSPLFLDTADALWKNQGHHQQNGPVRDAAYVSWYCLGAPSKRFTTFSKTTPGGEQVYAMTHHFGDGSAYLVDIWPRGAEVGCVRSLLKMTTAVLGQHGFHSLHVSHLWPEVSQACKKIRIKRDRTVPLRSLYRTPQGTDLGNEQDWPMNFGDYGL